MWASCAGICRTRRWPRWERLRLLVEGVNNKIRVLQRRAYGYRDEEYLKAEDRGGIPSAITQKCRLQPTRIRVDPIVLIILILTCLPLVAFADAERDADLQTKVADKITMSIDLMAHSFPGSQVRLEPLARLLGESHPGIWTRGVISGFEGFLFGVGLVWGLTGRHRTRTAQNGGE